ncbi:prolyl oligopeptidase family serine peptidase [Roseateles cellulosilyticus]|uniref:Prolyl oligopeptidase family serine peptidase n=1 Tax=Pelomonas cellulosilytica TaxID=2906762 RepID=A0ABS8XV02_9BURK|nr:prolyl oligopeptidase family serine peptidase [Pelomonas sp. P8]MCE4554641.1 prolyl oligopeptidase family serine peptidase [Pelomonas sp. P8]
MRSLLLAPACALLWAAAAMAAAQPASGPTVRDIVEFTRLVQPESDDPEALRQLVSPDGRRAFIVTRKANVSADKNRYEIQLLSLDPGRLAAGRVTAPETVFSFDAEQDGNYADPALKQIRWVNDRTLAFLGRLKDGVRQAYRLDVHSRELNQLTHAATPVVSFALSNDMRRIVFAAQVANPPMQDGARSIVYGNQPFWTVKWGQQRLISQLRKYQFYVADVASTDGTLAAKLPRPLGEPFVEANVASPVADISPDGRWAVLPRYERDRTLEWSRQYPLLAEFVTRFAMATTEDPLRYFSGANVRTARRMVAWRLEDAMQQTIVDAPDDALPAAGQFRQDRLWQGQGTSLILAGTQLPIATKDTSPASSYVIEYWPDTDRWVKVAKLTGRLQRIYSSHGGVVVVDGGGRRWLQRMEGKGWEEVAAPNPKAGRAEAAWSLQLQQTLNTPPDLFAKGTEGQAVRLTTLNPQFHAATWGNMKPYAWRDSKERGWIGGLMGPEGFERQGRLPLVIQTYYYEPDNFYLDGPNVGVSPSAYAGRAFVRHGILVLGMDFRPQTGAEPPTDKVMRLRQFQDGVRAAVNALVKEGRVDPDRVGIIGWSTTGEQVLNLVTFTDIPIRAATSADGDISSLFAYSIAYGAEQWQHMEATNQGVPFGPARAEWIRNDPAMNTECVRAALRLEAYGVPVYGNYDIYTLLRRQYKPVEMVFIPGGFHMLSTPSDRMISLQGNLDWFRYWLKGEKRTSPSLPGETASSIQGQYDAWDQMAKMKAANDEKPLCARVAERGQS